MWTASNQKKGYMVITAHYIGDDWSMQSRILRYNIYFKFVNIILHIEFALSHS